MTMDSAGLITYDGTGSDSSTLVTFNVTDATGIIVSKTMPVVRDSSTIAAWWRVKVMAPISGTNYGSMQELEFRANIGGSSLCVGGTPFATSYFNPPAYLPSLAFDGDVTSSTNPECWAGNGTEPTPALGYHLPAPSVVRQVMICARHISPEQSPKTFVVQSSTDTTDGINGTWNDEWTVTGQPAWAAGEIRTFNRP
jgi:hypothetical protein